MLDYHTTCYVVTWKSDTQRTRKAASFPSFGSAQDWYDEKLSEGKKPKFFSENTTVTYQEIL